jgi:hypothetical protein
MSLDITIQLDDQDLDHFIEAMRRAQVKAAGLSPQAIVDAASKLLVGVPTAKVPHFIKDRLEKLDQMIQLGLWLKDLGPDSIHTGVIDQRYVNDVTTSDGAQVLTLNPAALPALLTEVFGGDYAQP